MKKMSMCALALCVAVYAAAQTTISVEVAVRKTEVTAGPYARYAQKFLGVTAPLTDKVIYELMRVKFLSINSLETTTYSSSDPLPAHMNPAKGFPKLTVDKTSSAAISLEESARLAAEKIFALRRSRLELITGEVGENVFGGGLGAALNEISRLEEEYLSLFLGSQITFTTYEPLSVTPEKGRLRYVLTRFSESTGLTTDASVAPLMLELKIVSEVPEPPLKPSKNAESRLFPAMTECKIVLTGAEKASKMIEIDQFGQTILVEP